MLVPLATCFADAKPASSVKAAKPAPIRHRHPSFGFGGFGVFGVMGFPHPPSPRIIYAPPEKMVYIEKDLVQDNPPDYVWYYCRSQQTYYPYVIECPEAWEEVHPSANLDTGTSSTNAQ